MDSIEEKLSILADLRKEHQEAAAKSTTAAGGDIFPFDFMIWGAINRSMSVIDGFTLMIQHENFMCSAVLLRVQLDSLARLFAFSLVDDVHELSMEVLKGKHIRNIRDKESNKMTDAYLIEKISEKFDERFTKIYESTSNFVHFSSHHINAPVMWKKDRNFSLHLSGGVPFEKNDGPYHEAVDAFTAITRSILLLVDSWSTQKEAVSKQRDIQD